MSERDTADTDRNCRDAENEGNTPPNDVEDDSKHKLKEDHDDLCIASYLAQLSGHIIGWHVVVLWVSYYICNEAQNEIKRLKCDKLHEKIADQVDARDARLQVNSTQFLTSCSRHPCLLFPDGMIDSL